MALPPLELPPIEKGRPVAGRPFCVVDNKDETLVREHSRRDAKKLRCARRDVDVVMRGENFADEGIADRMTKESPT
jgi:hypothetical protein